MFKIKFIYERNIYEKAYDNYNITLNDIFKEYAQILGNNFDNLLFLYNGKKITSNNKEKLNIFNRSHFNISVFNIQKKINFKQLKHILCPKCNNPGILNIKNNEIIINNCPFNHSSNLTINGFLLNINIDESKIKCDICGNRKNIYDIFYFCSCNIKICPLCYNSLHRDHNKIFFEERFNICINHYINFISYCETCKKDLCEKCEEKHKNHNINIYKKRKPSEKVTNEIKNNINELKENILQYKNKLIILNNYLNEYISKMSNDFDEFNQIYEIILNCFHNINNYESLMNILNLKGINIKNNLNGFTNEEDKNIFKNLM